MSDLDLIRRLGNRLGRPLEQIPEEQFAQNTQIQYLRNRDKQELINKDGYSLAEDGRTVTGLSLEPVTSHLLIDFPLHKLQNLRHLYLIRVNLSGFDFLAELQALTTLCLISNQISDCSFLSHLTQLTTLNLRFNQISDCSFLSNLTGLTNLNLGDNQISDCSPLGGLTKLTSLHLRSNQISDCSPLSHLTGLKTLFLSTNQISDCSSLSKLKGLKRISLSRNPIRDYSFLSHCTGLINISLRSNQISDCSFLSCFKALAALNLSVNQISDYSFLSSLKNLEILSLRSNQISDCSFLSDLKNLTSLSLSRNQIVDCSTLSQLRNLKTLNLNRNQIKKCSFLKDLNNLETLNLSSNPISDYSALSQLKRLTALYLSSSQIKDCSFLSRLTTLTTLFLSDNQIQDCSPLRQLNGLTTLYLSSNQIKDCSFLSSLKQLTTLYLSSNQISDCSNLKNLKQLKTLSLASNQIKDCSFLCGLKALSKVNLSTNKVEEISQEIAVMRLLIRTDGASSSGYINLRKNPIASPPLEIVSQGNEAILSYYAQSQVQGQDYLYEAKMLIVGEGEAGKTTLAHKILEPNCPLPHVDDRTRGISINVHNFSCRKQDRSASETQRKFHLNIWDFGGQEIYHATHRFFLSKRSLYVLVADNRKDDTDFNYWLNIIERFAGKSPLIIVLNEKGDVQRSLNRAELLSRYPDSIKEIVPINFKTYEELDQTKAQQRLRDIHTLIGHVEHCAQNLSHIGEAVPARWVDVRDAIEHDDRNYIYREQFEALCLAHGMSANQDVDTLLSYFHDLGVLLHFASNALLRDRVIINPTWATSAVYRVFDDDRIKAKAGRFSRQDCADIWSDPQYRHMHDVLLELMKNFRLIYEIDQTGELVAPQLLPQNTPAYDWDEAHNSHMQLRYDTFMPKGIFWQFAVTLYRYIDNHNWVWRNGMVIRRGNTWAEIKEDLNLRRISLRFSGPSIPEFRAVIVDQLDKISQSYHRLDYDKMIPCQCDDCKDSHEPHFFRYAVLKRRQESGKKSTIECQYSEADVSLSLLLEGFDVPAILERLPDQQAGEPNPPADPPSRSSRQTIKIFLASSSELRADREQFEIFISRQNDIYFEQGIRLQLVLWENLPNALSQTRSQDEYNQEIATCDVFVSLFHTKVGQYTEEEFLTALETFKNRDRPLIYTYFKDAAINMSRITPDIMTLLAFKQKLSDMGHFYQHYADINDLKHQFGEQILKFLPKLVH